MPAEQNTGAGKGADATMAAETSDGGPCEKTDRHLWPDVSKYDAPHESIHVTKEGFIGINCGGYVYVKPLSEWHKLAGGKEAMQPRPDPVSSNDELRTALHFEYAADGRQLSREEWLIAELTAARAAHETPARPAGVGATERLHRICDALSEQADESPYTREEWERIDKQTVRMQNALRQILGWREIDDTLGGRLREIERIAQEALDGPSEKATGRPAEPYLPCTGCNSIPCVCDELLAAQKTPDDRMILSKGHDDQVIGTSAECPECKAPPDFHELDCSRADLPK